jgi:hypothetical protein
VPAVRYGSSPLKLGTCFGKVFHRERLELCGGLREELMYCGWCVICLPNLLPNPYGVLEDIEWITRWQAVLGRGSLYK